ncbi:MAG: hypothetical protein K6U78_04565 [Anaerolineae bacterium]|nr:hypothetical protein [Anaerolineae bacterium]
MNATKLFITAVAHETWVTAVSHIRDSPASPTVRLSAVAELPTEQISS